MAQALLRRTGWQDQYTDARLQHLTGTTYPAAPGGLWIALYRAHPLADGSDAASLELVRVGPVTFGSPSLPAGQPLWPQHRYIEPTAPVTVTVGTPKPGFNIEVGVQSFGILTQANGGTPVYIGGAAIHLPQGVATAISPSALRIFAEVA